MATFSALKPPRINPEKESDEFSRLLHACRMPSISVGIIDEGRTIFTNSFGFRSLREPAVDAGSNTVLRNEEKVVTGDDGAIPSDNEARIPGCTEQTKDYLPATPDTAYLTASCSKLFLACAVGILVDEGKLGWDDPIAKHVPEFNPVRDRLIRNATIRNVLSHTSGLGGQVLLHWGANGTVLVDEDQAVQLLNHAPVIPVGDTKEGLEDDGATSQKRKPVNFRYNNLNYVLAAFVIQNASGQRYSDFLQKRILDPLGMTQTIVTREGLRTNDNIAIAYALLGDNTYATIEQDSLPDESHNLILSCVGVWSSVRDMLRLSFAMMEANQTHPAVPEGNPLRQLPAIWAAQKTFDDVLSYSMGCARSDYPSTTLSKMSNCKTGPKKLYYYLRLLITRDWLDADGPVVWSLDTWNGFHSCLIMLPVSRTSIVALTNGGDVENATKWAVKILRKRIFDTTPTVNISELAHKESEKFREQFKNMLHEWLENRDITHKEADLTDYIGEYKGCNTTIKICLCEETGLLAMTINGREKPRYDLELYNRDTYSFMPLQRDDWLRKGMYNWQSYRMAVLHFSRNDDGLVDYLAWMYNNDKQKGELFEYEEHYKFLKEY